VGATNSRVTKRHQNLFKVATKISRFCCEPFGTEPFVLSPAVKNVKVRIYKTIILPVVLYGCETWYLTVREKHKLRVFEKRVLRRIFWPRRDGVTGGWRKLHKDELHNLYSSP
jgi:hypothetical protein